MPLSGLSFASVGRLREVPLSCFFFAFTGSLRQMPLFGLMGGFFSGFPFSVLSEAFSLFTLFAGNTFGLSLPLMFYLLLRFHRFPGRDPRFVSLLDIFGFEEKCPVAP